MFGLGACLGLVIIPTSREITTQDDLLVSVFEAWSACNSYIMCGHFSAHGNPQSLAPDQVQELKPSSAVSVIDTDLEAEVVASLETETHIRDWQAEQQRQADAVVAFAAERERAAAAAAADVALRAQLVAERALADSVRRERFRQEKEANLPPEPSTSDNDQGPILTCVFRLPDGGRFTRRVRAQDQLQLLFDFVDSKGAGGLESGSYSLVSQFPRRLLSPASGVSTLEQLEMSGGQHSFFVEARTAGNANDTIVEGEGVRVS